MKDNVELTQLLAALKQTGGQKEQD
jgi:hypothetical protein